MKSSSRTDLSDPAGALASYLDDLLQTASAGALEQRQPSVVAEVPVRLVEVRPAPPKAVPGAATKAPQPLAPAPVESAEKRQVKAAPAATAMPVPRSAVSVESPADTGPPDTRPDWSERPFECLIFKVAGLQLAVPLVLLGAIHRIEDRIKPIPVRPRWYLGMLPDRNQNLRIVDTAEWIMAGRVPDNARDGYRFVIRLDNSEWALACDDVAQSFTLNPDEVRWRSARSKRPWLAGTVIQHMCALIDVGTMASMLVRAEKEHTLTLE